MAFSYSQILSLWIINFVVCSSNTELHVNLFKNEGFKGSYQTHIVPSDKECVSLGEKGRKASSAQVLQGNCIRICKEACGHNIRKHSENCMYIHGKLHNFDDNFSDQVNSIRRCSDEINRERRRSKLLGFLEGNSDIGYEVGQPPIPQWRWKWK